MKKIIFISILLITLNFISCKSTEVVPEDLTIAQLIQKGQDAYGISDYKSAEVYYLTAIERFGDDTNTYIEVKYELGHLYLKTKDYDKAFAAFTEILELYDYASTGLLPPEYKKLAQIGLSKIPEDKLN